LSVAYLAERGVPRRAPAGLKVIGVRTLADLFSRLFA